MPTIPKKPKNYHSETPKRQLRRRLYNLAVWKNLSKSYRTLHPVCEICEALEKDVADMKATEHVHHILSPFDDGLPDWLRLGRLSDPYNIVAVCKHHHDLIHQGKIAVEVDFEMAAMNLPYLKVHKISKIDNEQNE